MQILSAFLLEHIHQICTSCSPGCGQLVPHFLVCGLNIRRNAIFIYIENEKGGYA